MLANHRLRALLGAAVTIGALALPAAALSHPSIYYVTAKMAPSEVQELTVTSTTTGTFKPSAGAPSIPHNASAAQVQAALEADPAIGVGSVKVTGTVPFTLTFRGLKAATDVPQVAPVNDTDGIVGATTTLQGNRTYTYATDNTGAQLTDDPRYLFVQHGYTAVFRETNGRTTSGALSYAFLPGSFRNYSPTPGMTGEERRAWLAAASGGLQVHATCDTPALTTGAAVLGWQEPETAGGAQDPFYDYVPFQGTASGFDDAASLPKWVAQVKTLTGVDLATKTTEAELKAACEALPSGRFYPADVTTGPIGGPAGFSATGAHTGTVKEVIAATKAPLDAQIATLNTEKTGLASQLTAAKAAYDAALAKALDRPLTLSLSAKRFTPRDAHLLTGKAGTKAVVTVSISKALAKSLGLKSTTVATAKVTLNGQGAALVKPVLSKAAAKALATRLVPTPVAVQAVAGTTKVNATGTLLR